MSTRRAFTLVEMTVVITVLLVLTALVTPSVAALKRSRDQRTLEAAVLRLPAEARQEAQRAQTKVVIRTDGDALVLEQQPTDGDPVEVKRLTLTDGVSFDSAHKDGESIDLASWEWDIFADGSAQSADLALNESGTTKTLIFEKNGDAHWSTGDESASEERWQAGELEQRA